MKYTQAIEIKLPVEKVIELFENTENLYKWMTGLEHFEHISGEAGQPGAKSKLTFKMRNRTIEMYETIVDRNLPELFSAKYEAKGVENWVYNYFKRKDDNTTAWITDSKFKFTGFMKIMAFFMRGSFPKQTYKHMQKFKEFAESVEA